MATLENYHGLQVLEDDDNAQPGGGAISKNFRQIVEWHPKSNWEATDDPTEYDDETKGYYPGSFWLNTSTPELFVCVTNGVDTAAWHSIG